jgi:DNA-damage-inducible protein J
VSGPAGTAGHCVALLRSRYLLGASRATVRALIDPDLKRAAEDALERLGLSPSAAITLFYEQIVLRRGLPFEVAAPNSTTREAMADAEDGRVTRAPDGRSLIAQID